MLYDCFLFHNEFDILEIRLGTLYPHVDRFVLVEMNHTFSGKPKEMLFEPQRNRFEKYLHKLIHVKVMDHPEHASECEPFQRNAIMRGLTGACAFEDRVMISDVDEIPRPETLEKHRSVNHAHVFCQQLYYYHLNCACNELSKWTGTTIVPFYELLYKSPQSLRMAGQHIENGGWHFSYMGGTDMILHKIESLTYRDFDKPEIKNKEYIEKHTRACTDFGERGYTFRKVPIDSSYPAYLLQNLDRFKHLILD